VTSLFGVVYKINQMYVCRFDYLCRSIGRSIADNYRYLHIYRVVRHKAPPTSSDSNSNYVCTNVSVF